MNDPNGRVQHWTELELDVLADAIARADALCTLLYDRDDITLLALANRVHCDLVRLQIEAEGPPTVITRSRSVWGGAA